MPSITIHIPEREDEDLVGYTLVAIQYRQAKIRSLQEKINEHQRILKSLEQDYWGMVQART